MYAELSGEVESCGFSELGMMQHGVSTEYVCLKRRDMSFVSGLN